MGLRIVIVGAGIGGLTAALTLADQHHDVTVLERRTGFGETGAGIQLSPNATRILTRFGLGGALQRVSSAPERITVRSLRSGRRIGGVSLGGYAAERFGAPYLSVSREALHTILLDAVRTRGNVRLRVGRSATGLTAAASSVRLGYQGSGSEDQEIEADLLIGADGLWSRTRAVTGDLRRPAYSGYVAFRTTLPSDATRKLAGDTAAEPGLWLGQGRHVVHYPLGASGVVNMVCVERRLVEIEGWSSPESTENVLGTFGDAAPPLRELLGTAESWSAWSLYDLPARRLPAGRVALLGDAWHPALPFLAQGGALAIEDAAVLAAEVATADASGIPAAVRRYGARRLRRVRRVQAQARRNASVYHAGFPSALARDLVMRRLGPESMTRRYDWLYGWTDIG